MLINSDSCISVVVNTYNAEKYLREVLESLKNFDEIIVCDMDSNDDTLKIAKEYNCKILNFPKGNHRICEPARNFAIKSANNKWVLVVDADEVVPNQLRDYLYSKIDNPKFDSALYIPRKNMFMGERSTSSPDYQLRFFQKEKCFWPPTIHSRPKISGNIDKIPSNRKDLYLVHLDDPSISKRIDKMNRYSDYEVVKRKNKKYGFLKLLFRPFWFFLRSYLFQGGFKDGIRGLIRSYMAMTYQIFLLSKLMEYHIKSGSNNTNS